MVTNDPTDRYATAPGNHGESHPQVSVPIAAEIQTVDTRHIRCGESSNPLSPAGNGNRQMAIIGKNCHRALNFKSVRKMNVI